MKKYVFGVDLGGTTVKMGLFTTELSLIDKWEIPTRTENAGENLLPDISNALKEKMSEKNISIDEVEGVGIGVPGAVIDEHFVEPCVNLNQWGGEVAEMLNALCGLPVKVVNDANAAALGEMSQGGGKGYKNVVFITLGTGVGSGVIVDGKLLTGGHGAGGEIGHIKVSKPIYRACGCGKSGCLEQFASATGIVANTKSVLKWSHKPSLLRNFEDLTCKDIFDCAKEGDEIAVETVHVMTKMLGRALASVSCVCDPDIFVIGGGVSRAGDIVIRDTQEYFQRAAFPASEQTQFALAELGNDAGIYGAAQMILQ